MFHESGHIEFQSNSEIGGDRSPLLFVNKSFEVESKQHWKFRERGESGKCVDHFLYNSKNDEASIDVINSFRSHELMEKKYFTDDLKNLNQRAHDILSYNTTNITQIHSHNLHIINNLSSNYEN